MVKSGIYIIAYCNLECNITIVSHFELHVNYQHLFTIKSSGNQYLDE